MLVHSFSPMVSCWSLPLSDTFFLCLSAYEIFLFSFLYTLSFFSPKACMLEISAERPADNNFKKNVRTFLFNAVSFSGFLKIIIYFAHVLSGYLQFPKLCGCVVGVVVFFCRFKKNPFPQLTGIIQHRFHT